MALKWRVGEYFLTTPASSIQSRRPKHNRRQMQTQRWTWPGTNADKKQQQNNNKNETNDNQLLFQLRQSQPDSRSAGYFTCMDVLKTFWGGLTEKG